MAGEAGVRRPWAIVKVVIGDQFRVPRKALKRNCTGGGVQRDLAKKKKNTVYIPATSRLDWREYRSRLIRVHIVFVRVFCCHILKYATTLLRMLLREPSLHYCVQYRRLVEVVVLA